ncbi:hypothetical protein [Shouchella miscanthi]|uniref:Peptidase M10 metallopeptidase domain-containing protein n=1 Tax=Shouchella miscanthi TaxID=2598861 RepID=A0ABU6NJI5_9BACI|nr:hypothetical protein [Shouchella miscanthi]
MKIKFVFIAVALFFTISLSFPLDASAHGSSACKPGSENAGWKVRCNGHGGDDRGVVLYDTTGLSSKYLGYAETGAARLNATGLIGFYKNTFTSNKVKTYRNADDGYNAYVRAWYSFSHITKWEMNFNTYAMNNRTDAANRGTATHEFGHTVGMLDLYNSTNKNKILYGYGNTRTVTTPQAADKTGMKEATK